jgi:hypothetical protein
MRGCGFPHLDSVGTTVAKEARPRSFVGMYDLAIVVLMVFTPGV